ncbi:MAG: response regulator [Acidobacteria bacterium]|nr:response regulator [Acidobacteriota bacterium]
MSRILLVDDSPHAQRIGERILTEEGYEVVTVSNADSALIRLEDVDPDVVIADTVMPGRTGFELCQYLKMSPRHRHVRVILTAGVTEALDDAAAKRVEADGTLQKPFEASVLAAAVKPLAEAAAGERAAQAPAAETGKPAPKAPAAPFVAVVDSEQVRAAVTVALDASMGAMVEEIAGRVIAALSGKADPSAAAALTAATPPAPVPAPPVAIAQPDPPKPAVPAPAAASVQPVRRVTPLRMRSSSILGLELGSSEPESQDPE